MCGILGFVRISDTKGNIPIKNMMSAIDECQKRGRDAVGWYSDKTGLFKSPGVPLDKAVLNSDTIEKALDGNLFVLHTRAATLGFDGPAPAVNNENNHPFEGERYVIVHNGVIRYTPKLKKYKYAGHCDSELVLGLIETFGVKKGLEFLDEDDSFSLVIYDKQTKELHFARHTNPMVFSYSDSIIYFGSTSTIVLEMDEGVELGDLAMYEFTQCMSTPENRLITLKNGKFELKNLTFRKSIHQLHEKDGFDIKSFKDKYTPQVQPSGGRIVHARFPVEEVGTREKQFYLQMVRGRVFFDEPISNQYTQYGAFGGMD